MKLLYPISSELFTFVHLLNRTIELSLRRECGLSVVQYRMLSCLKQAGALEEARMARMLEVGASHLSLEIGSMANQGHISLKTKHGPAKTARITAKGRRLLSDADLVLIDACNKVFEPMGPELGIAIRSGSMLTNQRHGIVRIEDGSFFEEHACFEAFLQAERITKASTHGFGLTQTEFRIMFELLSNGPASKSVLARRLMMAPSVVSDACRKLADRLLLAETRGLHDRRMRTVALTGEGRSLAEKAALYVDRRSFEDLRPSSDAERDLYQHMADIVVRA